MPATIPARQDAVAVTMPLMRMQFTKMQGLGNDFVVIDATREPVALDAGQLRRLADRRFGVGCDQVLMVEPAPGPEADFGYRIFNADGGEVEHCGNGARCFARYVTERGLFSGDRIRVSTAGGPLVLYLEEDGQVRVDMGVPVLAPSAVPFVAEKQQPVYLLETGEEQIQIGVAGLGNPHAVLRVDDVDTAPVARLGPVIESHERFPRRVNAGFMQVISPDHIRLRVYERGVGETLACGTGACAAVIVGQMWELLAQEVAVDLPGGRLAVSWQGPGEPVWMRGPATTVFEGEIDL